MTISKAKIIIVGFILLISFVAIVKISLLRDALMIITFSGIAIPSENLPTQEWIELFPNINGRSFTTILEDNNPVIINVIRISPVSYQIKIIDVYGNLKGKEKYSIYNIREIVEDPNPLVVINGGFSPSYSLPLPSGLLIENSKIISPIKKDSKLLSGIFYIDTKGFNIIKKEEYREGYLYALQSGPIIIEYPAKPAIYKNEREKPKYKRSVVAIDKQGCLLLITTNEMHLYDLSQILVKEENQGGLNCVSALNLSGDEYTGLYINRKKRPIILGNTDVPIPSVIVVFNN